MKYKIMKHYDIILGEGGGGKTMEDVLKDVYESYFFSPPYEKSVYKNAYEHISLDVMERWAEIQSAADKAELEKEKARSKELVEAVKTINEYVSFYEFPEDIEPSKIRDISRQALQQYNKTEQ